MSATLRIIRPSSREQNDLLSGRLAELEKAGFRTLYDDLPADPAWAYTSASAEARAKAVMGALTEEKSDVVISARGGYGASDILPLLDWPTLARAKPKVLVGFSDVSALHSALYTRLGWVGVHGPMPATVLWRKEGKGEDVDALLDVLRKVAGSSPVTGSIPLTRVGSKAKTAVEGTLFGGCFTVLTNLLGTPYFPRSLAGHVVFIEDTDEHPGRLARALNQWVQSGTLAGVRALVVGHLRGLGEKIPDNAPFVLEQLARRCGDLPVFHSPLFGHTSPNFPLMVGADAAIRNDTLTWSWRSSIA